VHRLAVLLDRAIVAPGLGLALESPLDVFLTDTDVLQPDLVVILRDRQPSFGPRSIEGPPSLVVDIASPSTSSRDRGQKRDLYARYGVPEYWFVAPDVKRLTVRDDPMDGRYRLEQVAVDVAISATIPGLTVGLAALFAPVFGA
jgi:Uma2 family endonuclease